MFKLTVFVPLKDRPEYTEVFLKNLENDFYYIFADGSKGNENQNLFKSLNLNNIEYHKFDYDNSVKIYVEKINKCLSFVKTQYVIMCDNDDFIIKKGAIKSVLKLENSEFACAGGPIYTTFQNTSLKNFYSLPRILEKNLLINGLNGYEDLKKIFDNYEYLYYSVYRTDFLRQLWKKIKILKIYHITLIEYFLTIFTILKSSYCNIGSCHYLRLRNPYTSSHLEENPHNFSHENKIFFDKNYREMVFNIAKSLNNDFNINEQNFLNDFKQLYINHFKKIALKRNQGYLIKIKNRLKNIFYSNILRIFNIKFIKFLLN